MRRRRRRLPVAPISVNRPERSAGRAIGSGHKWPLMDRLSGLYYEAIGDFVKANRQEDLR